MAADAKADASNDDDKKAGGAKNGGTSKLVVIALVMNMILSGAAVALGVTSSLGGGHEPKAAKAAPATADGGVAEAGHDQAAGGGDHGAPPEHGAAPEHAAAPEHGSEPAAASGGHGAAPGAPGAPGAAGAAKPANGHGPIVRLENIVVHLRNPEVDRFARLTVEYELASPADLAQFEGSAPHLRDGVITYVSDRTFEQLAGAAGITMLKRDLMEQATAIGHAKVRAIYITDFVIQ